MFQVSLDHMDYRRTELLEFEQKLNRLAIRLEEEIRRLGTMESFSSICIWLLWTEEQLEIQAGQVKELGTALESVIRLCRSSEEKILGYLEDGSVEKEDGTLVFKALVSPGGLLDILKF